MAKTANRHCVLCGKIREKGDRSWQERGAPTFPSRLSGGWVCGPCNAQYDRMWDNDYVVWVTSPAHEEWVAEVSKKAQVIRDTQDEFFRKYMLPMLKKGQA